TFKRLLRALRIPTDESPSPTKDDFTLPTPIPYQTLLPREVALLYINIGLIHAFLGSYYLAGQAFEEALVLDQTSAVAWFGLGIARFYSIELSASKKAFKKCKRCFIAQNVDGDTYQKNELIYEVWTGQSQATIRTWTGADHHDSEGSEGRLDPFKGIMSSRLPNGQWRLEWLRAEWNYRVAKWERNWIKHGVQRPGKWTLTGIPAGVIFDLDLDASRMTNTDTRQAGNDIGVKDARVLDVADTTRADNSFTSSTDSPIKRKWFSLQERFLNRESSTRATKRSRLLGWVASSQSHSSPASSSQQTPAVNSDTNALPAPTQAAFPCSPAVGDSSPPPSSPPNPHVVQSSYDDDSNDEEIHPASDHPADFANETSSVFPNRQSSLTALPIRPSRHSRGVSLSINTAIHGLDKIEEELFEAGNEPISQTHPLSPDSAEISPLDTSHGIYNGFLKPQIFGQDFRVFPDTKQKRSTSFSSTKSPVQQAEYGHDSFNTDAISSLGSGMKSAFFSRMESMEGERSRGGSRATNRSWSALEEEQQVEGEERKPRRVTDRSWSAAEQEEQGNEEEDKEEEEEDKGEEPEDEDEVEDVTFTITPSTPIRLQQERLAWDPNLDLRDCLRFYTGYWGPDPPREEMDTSEINMATLSRQVQEINEDESVNVGRTDLGQSEWEEAEAEEATLIITPATPSLHSRDPDEDSEPSARSDPIADLTNSFSMWLGHFEPPRQEQDLTLQQREVETEEEGRRKSLSDTREVGNAFAAWIGKEEPKAPLRRRQMKEENIDDVIVRTELGGEEGDWSEEYQRWRGDDMVIGHVEYSADEDEGLY
ncbi:MAG: hypothetical protein L6R42_005761, partial [Xanthoria sp. 1 TBL-2021]